MADIRITQLPNGTPTQSKLLPMDLTATEKATIKDIVYAGRPAASQAEAEAGTDPDKVMTPLTTRQALVAYAATTEQGGKADTAMQPTVYDPAGVGKDAFDVANWNISVARFGASPSNTSAQNETAFDAAEAVLDVIYVPAGTYQLSTPLNRGYTKQYYGPGVLRFDNAEWLRPGGSSGSISVPEHYTLFYEYENQSDVSVSFNGIGQTITWVDNYTVQAPGSLTTDAVRVNIVNGKKRLGPTPDMVRSFNTIDGQAPNLAPSQTSATAPLQGYDNWFFGTQTPIALTTGLNNTFGGSRAGRSITTASNNTGFGFQALYRASGGSNTAVGSIAGEWITTGTNNSLLGALAGAKIKTGTFNTASGYDCFGENETGNFNSAYGYRALANPREDIGGTPDYSSAFGVFSGDFAFGDHNSFFGYRAGQGVVGGSDGTENCSVGSFSMQNHAGADYNAAFGVASLQNITSGQYNFAGGHSSGLGVQAGNGNVAIGHNTLQNNDGNNRIAIGNGAGTNLSASGGIAIGLSAAAAATTADGLVAIGNNAGINLTTGTQATFLGANSGRFDFGGTPITTFTNFTVVGYDARVSASNQVQLGNAATTTYVYGTVQNRSDERDKTDIRDTELGLKFIMGLRPVDGRWDMRDDYIETVEEDVEVQFTYTEEVDTGLLDPKGGPIFKTVERVGVRTEKQARAVAHPRDGSKKRNRFHHWFIAQEVKELCDKMGVDFGGFQDHSVNGGGDVLSLGYDEFIPPMVKAIQELSAEVARLKASLPSPPPSESV